MLLWTVALMLCLPLTGVHAEDSLSVNRKANLVLNRADPWVYRSESGHYYFTASVPEFDRIILRQSATIDGLSEANEQVIWRQHPSGEMSANIWAPELHRIDGAWYIYFAAGKQEAPFSIRMYVLQNTSTDPMQGQWTELGRLVTARDTFSLDATSFTHGQKRYLVWAQQDDARSYNSGLVLAELDSPNAVSGKEVYIAEPTYDWEERGFKVNEGAAVLKRHGKIFITYSASATDHRYAMGLLWADENADLLDPASWHKLPEPVFTTNESLFRFGPGHNSFTLAEDGKTDMMIYHARDYKKLQGTPLTDGNRHTRYRQITWTQDGFPEFHNNRGD
ncbi:glycoside hydrolase family 43 protein [Thalassotalea mangrovi]|nr:glycoside hydrolase family 43 protein [Thalassotalea mangrovi]